MCYALLVSVLCEMMLSLVEHVPKQDFLSVSWTKACLFECNMHISRFVRVLHASNRVC